MGKEDTPKSEHVKAPASAFTVRDGESRQAMAPGSEALSRDGRSRRAIVAIGGTAMVAAAIKYGPRAAEIVSKLADGSELVGFVRDELKEKEEAAAKRKEELAAAHAAMLYQPANDIPRHLSAVFPFIHERSQVNFHPNTDNQLLKAEGIGDEDASLADFLAGQGPSIAGSLSDDLIVTSPALAARPNLKVFSFATLAQSHYLYAALGGHPVIGADIVGSFENVRRNFYPGAVNIIMGSPTGNRLAGLAHGKVRRPESDRRRELMHEGIPGFVFPFEFSLDRETDEHIYDPATKKYAWTIKDTATDVPYRATGDTDFFTISVLPNYLVADFHRLPPLVLIEGCSALGTTGASVLWSSSGARELAWLVEQRRHSAPKYWQALFRITGATPPMRNAFIDKDERRATHVEPVKFVPIHPPKALDAHPERIRKSLHIDLATLQNRTLG